MKGIGLENLEAKFNLNKEGIEQKDNVNQKKDYQLNIYNNFLITNSTITQMLDTFLSSKKTLPQSIF